MLWGYGYGWTGMLWMGLGTLFWITVLVLAIWFLARLFMGRAVPLPSGRPPMPPSAMEILRQRYARGEIDTETFVTMRNQLEASANGAASSQNLYERDREPLMPLSDT